MNSFQLSGNLIDIRAKKIYKACITVKNGIITDIEETDAVTEHYILPGFIDAHVHIESSMLIPSEFARLAVPHGTVATVSDPHEIGNVLGTAGVEYMINNGKSVPFKFYFGAPSCVPATTFETAGATITPKEIEFLLQKPEIKYLAEMMNWPGVLNHDSIVYEKIDIAKKYHKVIDGHAPGLRGEQARQYAEAGMSTDHECFTKEEALDKLRYGMKILIREGSAAKNFDALIDLLDDYEDAVMFCSDDKHPDNLVEGHINELVKRAQRKGFDLFKILKAACVNPVLHYQLEVGLLRKNDPADFIVINHPDEFKILQTYINGNLVAVNGKSHIARQPATIINNFNTSPKNSNDFCYKSDSPDLNVIEAMDGQLITNALQLKVHPENGEIKPDIERDLLKIAVVNRYRDTVPAIAFIKGFGLKEGALASSVAHDSHNIVAVGADDESICKAVNEVIKHKGGIAAVSNNTVYSLPLPVAGLMSANDGYEIAHNYTSIDAIAKKMGSTLSSPFMTLSFMALLVIPSLKLSDLGLFDGEKFKFVK